MTENKAAAFAVANSPAARAYDTADTTNKEGHKAWTQPLKERVVQMLLTNTLDNTFYADSTELAKDCHDIYREALREDPEFLAKAIVYARNTGLMRLQPIVGLVHLSNSEHKHLFRAAFKQTVKTPHDLASFIEWCKVGGIRQGLGRAVKDAVNEWLNTMSEYHAIKYPLSGNQFSARNILRLCKPKPSSPQQSALFGYIAKGEASDATPQIAGYEAAKAAAQNGNFTEFRRLIEEHKLPYETLTGIGAPDKKTWVFLMHQMPHMALMRHLNTMERHGVFEDKANRDWAIEKLTNADAVRKARVLPFQYFTAWQAYTNSEHHNDVADALVTALEISYENIPEVPGEVIIGNDVSGSMSHRINDKGAATYADIAGLFGAAMFKKSPRATLLPADSQVRLDYARLSRHDSILTNATKLAHASGGTDLGAAIQHVNARGLPMDVYVGITDSEEWLSRRFGWAGQSSGFYGEWLSRKNKNAKAFLVRIDPYDSRPAPVSDPSIYTVYGWNAAVLSYIALTLQGMGGQVEAVEAVDLAA